MSKPVGKNEIARRLKAVRAAMKKAKLDGYLVLDRANTRYISGFRCSASFILLTANEAWFITDSRYIEAARKGIPSFNVVKQKDATRDLARLIKKAGIERLGVEKSLPYGTALEYQKAFSPAELVANDDPLRNARIRKSRLELDLLRESTIRADRAYEDLVQDICEGWTEIETRNRLRRWIERHGGEIESFDSIVGAGKHASKPHSEPTDYKLRRGDVVQIDTGLVYEGYCSDLSRVFCVGRPSEKLRKIHRIVVEAQKRAIDAVRAGVKARDIDAKARDYIAKKGYGKAFVHGTGHGVGLEIHEYPIVNAKSKDILREGMVITIEPGIYLPGWGGVRIEDVVIVKRGGFELLTTARKDIVVV